MSDDGATSALDGDIPGGAELLQDDNNADIPLNERTNEATNNNNIEALNEDTELRKITEENDVLKPSMTNRSISLNQQNALANGGSQQNIAADSISSHQNNNNNSESVASGSRRDSKSVYSVASHQPTQKRRPSAFALQNQNQLPTHTNLADTIQSAVSSFVRSKIFDYLIIILVLCYTAIIFLYFALDTKEYEDNGNINTALDVISYIELSILVTFCFEIFLKVYADSITGYFKDTFNLVDAVIIVLSMGLTIADIIVTGKIFSQISRIIRSIFRFVRLFLVFKKVNEIQQTSSLNLHGLIKTPVERIMDILQNINENVDDIDLAKQIKWCMDMVSSNKLYEPILGDGEAAVWGNIYASGSGDAQKKKKNPAILTTPNTNATKPGQSIATTSLFDPTTPSQFIFKPILVPMEHVEAFKRIDEITFDIFKYHATVKENHLEYLLIHLFNRYDIFFKAHIEPQQLFNWATSVANGYQDNFYHNKIHAFDVTQTMHYFIQTMDFLIVSEPTALEIGIMYMAAAVHDYEHPGFNNPYLVNTRHEFAIRYNDKSPLENHHAASAFALMNKENNNSNVFVHLSKEDKKKSRERIINMILHTDNSQHFADLAKLKGRLTATDFDPKEKDKDICMMALLHSSDVSNPFKPWDICKPWTERVLAEFWNQGDSERNSGLPITYLCDRYTTNTSKSQAGFIDFIVKPLYDTVKKFLPKLDTTVFETNKAKWAELIQFYDEDLAKLNKQLKEEQGEGQKENA